MTGELTAAEFGRANNAFEASSPRHSLFVTPQDVSYARVGCEGCVNAVYQKYRGDGDSRLQYSIGVSEISRSLRVPYDVVETGSRSGRGGNCAAGACKLDKLNLVTIETNLEGSDTNG